jgi:hypothetical protein
MRKQPAQGIEPVACVIGMKCGAWAVQRLSAGKDSIPEQGRFHWRWHNALAFFLHLVLFLDAWRFIDPGAIEVKADFFEFISKRGLQQI